MFFVYSQQILKLFEFSFLNFTLKNTKHCNLSFPQRRSGGGVGVGVGGGVGVGVVGGGARARPYVRHAARWPHHPLHHLHTQVRGEGGLQKLCSNLQLAYFSLLLLFRHLYYK